MADVERDEARPFHELRGDYVENAGQQITLREYLDYYEPLGSALARLPDGSGGPFVHHFTDGGGRTIGSLGWVVSAKSKRFGGWTLWGMWADRPMPALALPLFWPMLSDASRIGECVERANDDAEELFRGDLARSINASRLRDKHFRELLKAELARAYAVPLPHRHPIEIDLTPAMLDLLPWIYLFGPVDPAIAQLKPNRFDTPGYQYILADDVAPDDVDIPQPIERLVDETAKNVANGWRLANELRARRKPPQTRERNVMRPAAPSPQPPSSRKPAMRFDPATIITPVFQLLVIALLVWIGWNTHLIRKAVSAPAAVATETSEPAVSTSAEPPPRTEFTPVTGPDLSRARLRRVAAAVRAQKTLRIADGAINDPTADKLARVAVEVFLRRNGCLQKGDAIDGKLSTTEQRAIRACKFIEEERLMASDTEPDVPRAIDWLEKAVR